MKIKTDPVSGRELQSKVFAPDAGWCGWVGGRKGEVEFYTFLAAGGKGTKKKGFSHLRRNPLCAPQPSEDQGWLALGYWVNGAKVRTCLYINVYILLFSVSRDGKPGDIRIHCLEMGICLGVVPNADCRSEIAVLLLV